MEELLRLANSPTWWVTAVLLAVVLNLASEYLKRLLDYVGSFVWSKWRDRTESAKERYAENVRNLRADTNLQFFVMLRAVQLRGSANSWLLVAALLFIFSSLRMNIELAGLIIKAMGYTGVQQPNRLDLVLISAGVCTLISTWQAISAKQREKLVMDARSPQSF